MENNVLDAEIKELKRKPLKVVKTAVICALVALLIGASFSAYIFSSSSYNSVSNNRLKAISVILSYFLPIAVGMFLIAAKGNRNWHFLRILGTGMLSYQLVTVAIFGFIYFVSFMSVDYSYKIDVIHIELLLNLTLFVLILAFILWLIPGKLPYFRKHVEP